VTCTLFHFFILYAWQMLIWVIQYISIEDNAGGAKPPAPLLNSYATHHLIPQALYNDEIVIGCGGFGIKPCGAPNLVIACGFSYGYKKNIRENMYVTPLSLRQYDQ